MSRTRIVGDERWRSLAAVIASMAVVSLIYGLTYPLLALVLERDGVDGTLIGLNTASQTVAIFAVAPIAPRLIARFGPASLMLACVGASVAIFALLPVFPDVYAWFALRFALGCANSFMWIAGEAWVNQLADEKTRGRIIGFYSTALAGGFALGPLVLAQIGTEGLTPFLVSAVLIALTGAPLLLVASGAPRMAGTPSVRLFTIVLLAPAAMLANLALSAADGILTTFLPIYAMRLGLSESAGLYLITAMGIGGIAFQIPIGWLVDHVERRLLLTLSVLIILAASAAMPVMTTLAPWNWLYMFIYGGMLGGLYTIGLVLMGERFRGPDLAAAATVFSVMWGTGAITGPIFAGLGFELWDPHGMAVVVVLIFVAYAPVPLVAYLRGRRSERPPGPGAEPGAEPSHTPSEEP